MNMGTNILIFNSISIPIWSDFSNSMLLMLRCTVLISIPIWSDFSDYDEYQFFLDYMISIPIWSDFSQANEYKEQQTQANFNPNMV